jgi:alpha-D-ribose 1-methylphosphonate 5-phosphate C-P lyase
VLVYQVPQPEPLYRLEARRAETLALHAAEEYGLMNVKLYEDIAHWGHVETAYDYPVRVNGRYVMSPSPIPAFDNPKMHRMPALQLFGAGREKRLYAVPPYTDVVSLDFDDHPFEVRPQGHACALCGCSTSYLDEVVQADGEPLWTCSDTDWCQSEAERRAAP